MSQSNLPPSDLPPSPSMLPGAPSRGPGPFVAIAVLLVAAIVGAFLWINRSAAPAPSPTSKPVATASATATAALGEAPPPPPPVEEDAGAAAPDSGAKVAAGGGGGCGACRGTASAALRSALAGRAGSARKCYERALRVNSSIQGSIKVGVRVDSTGSVCSASLVEDSIHAGDVTSCVLNMYRGQKFPPAEGGCVEVNIPISFSPREGK